MYPKNDFRDYSSNSLTHYGVKGMKWGKHLPGVNYQYDNNPVRTGSSDDTARFDNSHARPESKSEGTKISGSTAASEAIKNAQKQSQYLSAQANKRALRAMQQETIARSKRIRSGDYIPQSTPFAGMNNYFQSLRDRKRVSTMKKAAIASGGTKISGNTSASEAAKQGQKYASHVGAATGASGVKVSGNTGASEAIKNAQKQSQYLSTQAGKRKTEAMKKKAIASGGTKTSGNTAASEAAKQGARMNQYLSTQAGKRKTEAMKKKAIASGARVYSNTSASQAAKQGARMNQYLSTQAGKRNAEAMKKQKVTIKSALSGAQKQANAVNTNMKASKFAKKVLAGSAQQMNDFKANYNPNAGKRKGKALRPSKRRQSDR